MKKAIALFGIMAALAYGNYAFADSKITDLAAVTVPALTDVLPVVQTSTDKKETLQQVHDLLFGSNATMATTAGVTYTFPGTSNTILASTASGVQTFLTTPSSANFASMITDETGTGAVVLGTNPVLTGPNYATYASTSTATGNINIDGASYNDYWFNNTSTAATYTPVITSAPAANTVRYVTLHVGGGTGVDTMTWTNVDFMGPAGAAATTTSKYSHYACIIPASGHAKCSIIAEASTY